MFNFFDELVFEYGLQIDKVSDFNLINISNKLLYVEGQKGVILISDDVISFKVKKGAICVYGEELKLKRITKTTLVIMGKIKKVESV